MRMNIVPSDLRSQKLQLTIEPASAQQYIVAAADTAMAGAAGGLLRLKMAKYLVLIGLAMWLTEDEAG